MLQGVSNTGPYEIGPQKPADLIALEAISQDNMTAYQKSVGSYPVQ